MWRLALDQNFNEDLFNEVERKHSEPDLDMVRLFDVGLNEASDEVVLEWAAQEERIVLTHDEKTMVPLANARISSGLRMPGLIIFRQTKMYGPVVEDLCIMFGASTPVEWEGQIVRLPYARGH